MENSIITNNASNANISSILNSQKKVKPKSSDLDREAFLKLLITELRHQDPSQPMENKEFISQMAQFSALEQMINVNKSVQTLTKTTRSGEAYSLLGKNVKALDIKGVPVEGLVTSVFYKDDEIRLIVNNREVGLNDIHAVYTNEPAKIQEKTNESVNNNSKDIKNIIDIKK